MPESLLKPYIDKELKAARGYKDKESKVYSDGREVLHGKDWTRRVRQLAARSNGMCERWSKLGKKHVEGCSGLGAHPHHIKPRWPVRDDRLENLAHLSAWCHSAEDERKIGGRS